MHALPTSSNERAPAAHRRCVGTMGCVSRGGSALGVDKLSWSVHYYTLGAPPFCPGRSGVRGVRAAGASLEDDSSSDGSEVVSIRNSLYGATAPRLRILGQMRYLRSAGARATGIGERAARKGGPLASCRPRLRVTGPAGPRKGRAADDDEDGRDGDDGYRKPRPRNQPPPCASAGRRADTTPPRCVASRSPGQPLVIPARALLVGVGVEEFVTERDSAWRAAAAKQQAHAQ
eukprot:scaffold1124_cov361-Prasinococcus_capsulatus_cf.AAC.4